MNGQHGTSPEITVIELWPIWCTCQRCNKPTRSKMCWPYYEEFLHPDDASEDKGYCPVCDECYRWLDEHASQLWLRTIAAAPPAPLVATPDVKDDAPFDSFERRDRLNDRLWEEGK